MLSPDYKPQGTDNNGVITDFRQYITGDSDLTKELTEEFKATRLKAKDFDAYRPHKRSRDVVIKKNKEVLEMFAEIEEALKQGKDGEFYLEDANVADADDPTVFRTVELVADNDDVRHKLEDMLDEIKSQLKDSLDGKDSVLDGKRIEEGQVENVLHLNEFIFTLANIRVEGGDRSVEAGLRDTARQIIEERLKKCQTNPFENMTNARSTVANLAYGATGNELGQIDKIFRDMNVLENYDVRKDRGPLVGDMRRLGGNGTFAKVLARRASGTVRYVLTQPILKDDFQFASGNYNKLKTAVNRLNRELFANVEREMQVTIKSLEENSDPDSEDAKTAAEMRKLLDLYKKVYVDDTNNDREFFVRVQELLTKFTEEGHDVSRVKRLRDLARSTRAEIESARSSDQAGIVSVDRDLLSSATLVDLLRQDYGTYATTAQGIDIDDATIRNYIDTATQQGGANLNLGGGQFIAQADWTAAVGTDRDNYISQVMRARGIREDKELNVYANEVLSSPEYYALEANNAIDIGNGVQVTYDQWTRADNPQKEAWTLQYATTLSTTYGNGPITREQQAERILNNNRAYGEGFEFDLGGNTERLTRIDEYDSLHTAVNAGVGSPEDRAKYEAIRTAAQTACISDQIESIIESLRTDNSSANHADVRARLGNGGKLAVDRSAISDNDAIRWLQEKASSLGSGRWEFDDLRVVRDGPNQGLEDVGNGSALTISNAGPANGTAWEDYKIANPSGGFQRTSFGASQIRRTIDNSNSNPDTFNKLLWAAKFEIAKDKEAKAVDEARAGLSNALRANQFIFNNPNLRRASLDDTFQRLRQVAAFEDSVVDAEKEQYQEVFGDDGALNKALGGRKHLEVLVDDSNNDSQAMVQDILKTMDEAEIRLEQDVDDKRRVRERAHTELAQTLQSHCPVIGFSLMQKSLRGMGVNLGVRTGESLVDSRKFIDSFRKDAENKRREVIDDLSNKRKRLEGQLSSRYEQLIGVERSKSELTRDVEALRLQFFTDSGRNQGVQDLERLLDAVSSNVDASVATREALKDEFEELSKSTADGKTYQSDYNEYNQAQIVYRVLYDLFEKDTVRKAFNEGTLNVALRDNQLYQAAKALQAKHSIHNHKADLDNYSRVVSDMQSSIEDDEFGKLADAIRVAQDSNRAYESGSTEAHKRMTEFVEDHFAGIARMLFGFRMTNSDFNRQVTRLNDVLREDGLGDDGGIAARGVKGLLGAIRGYTTGDAKTELEQSIDGKEGSTAASSEARSSDEATVTSARDQQEPSAEDATRSLETVI